MLKIFAGAMVLVGLVLAVNPELLGDRPLPSDPYEAIERRVTWGKVVGLGLVPLFHFSLRPWMPTIAATLSSLVAGYLVTRLIGIALDGSVAKQWMYAGIELLLLLPLVWWYLRTRT
ncbi:MAG: hypothetical protein MK135_03670 [Polyangiaceae bacterium]|nr:hypothetical protein [Polyangiaceae bacterium]